MPSVLQKSRPLASPKGQREVDEVRQIAFSNGGKIASSTSGGGGRHQITITRFGVDPDDKKFRAMLYAIEAAVRGQFDRGRPYQALVQFSLKSRFVDVIVRCMK